MGSGGGKGAGGTGPGTADGTGNGGGKTNGAGDEHVATGEVTGTAEGVRSGLGTALLCAVRVGFGSASDASREAVSGSGAAGKAAGTFGNVLGKRGLSECGTGGGASGTCLSCVLLSDSVTSVRSFSGAS